MSCPSLARVDYLLQTASHLYDTSHIFLESAHHFAIENVRFLNLRADGTRELVVESNAGGACQTVSDLSVFAFTAGHIRQVLNVPARFKSCIPVGSEYEQELDVPRTAGSHGNEFCFTKRTYVENGTRLKEPRVSYPCYP